MRVVVRLRQHADESTEYVSAAMPTSGEQSDRVTGLPRTHRSHRLQAHARYVCVGWFLHRNRNAIARANIGDHRHLEVAQLRRAAARGVEASKRASVTHVSITRTS